MLHDRAKESLPNPAGFVQTLANKVKPHRNQQAISLEGRECPSPGPKGQTHAKTHSLLYNEGTIFVMKLNTPPAKKLDKIMVPEERHGFLMSFRDIQNTAVDKNSCLPTQNLAFTSATSKRSSGAGQSGSGKKTKGDTSNRICYNCNQPGHLSTAFTEPKIDKQLWYKTKCAAFGSNSVPLNSRSINDLESLSLTGVSPLSTCACNAKPVNTCENLSKRDPFEASKTAIAICNTGTCPVGSPDRSM
ncbi:hypothetical protein MJO29_004272 [Puccinia striiformis f. sp. tritici]|nr:hypothetical protein Pst134EB_008476 [Puccinia striiformis f. sp. tritici]KAI7963845.1 hypothetical protein MJO29_004272 [Puccinia striiformis f. sp. tritici]